MAMALDLLRAPHIGIREFKDKISSLVNRRKTLILTDHGEPSSVLIPYQDMLELIDILEEIHDPKARSLVTSGRKSVKQGVEGIPVFPRA